MLTLSGLVIAEVFHGNTSYAGSVHLGVQKLSGVSCMNPDNETATLQRVVVHELVVHEVVVLEVAVLEVAVLEVLVLDVVVLRLSM